MENEAPMNSQRRRLNEPQMSTRPNGHNNDALGQNDLVAVGSPSAGHADEIEFKLADEIISLIAQPLVVLDRSLRVKICNLSFRQFFSISNQDAPERIVSPSKIGIWNIDALEDLIGQLQTDRSSVVSREIEVTAPGRDGHRLLVTARLLSADRPDSELFLLTFEDVSAGRRALEELEAVRRHNEEFLAMLGHELRNPLAPIASALELLGLQKNVSRIHEQACAIIERQVGQLKRVIDNLLDVSRMTTGRIPLQISRVSLNQILELSVESLQPLLDQYRHQLEISVPPQTVWVEADPLRLEQVCVNLLSNAAKFSEPEGKISVHVTHAGSQCQIQVKDSGIGIAPEFLPHVFEIFSQGERSIDRAKGGMGIGLPLAKRLIELHRGRIDVTSRPGEGTTFTVIWPTSLSVGTTVSRETETTIVPAPKSLRVMIVDDNEDSAQTLGMLLLKFGHEALTVHDGPTSIEAALDYQPQVILLDIGLPGLNGYEVAKTLRKQSVFKDVLIVAMTGYGQERDLQQSLQAGIDHHLIKPSDFGKLQKILTDFAKCTEMPGNESK